MELSSFITDTLVQIAKGVKDSQAEYDSLGGSSTVNGAKAYIDLPHISTARVNGVQSMVTLVDFDVTLTSESTNDNKGGIGVLLGAISAHGGKANSSVEGVYTRIKFSVPVVLP